MTEPRLLRTTCGYCSTGCNVVVQTIDGKPVKVLQAADYPVNLGRTCPKGYHMLKPLEAPDRATRPLLRNAAGELAPVSWDAALEAFVSRFKAVQAQHGPAAVAFLSTGQIPTEEMALLGALAKFGMGIVHGDGNTRQCMATAAVAYKQSFGFDAPPFTYEDFEESDLLVFVGANPLVAHPILWNRVKMNKRPHEIVVIDPRRTATAEAATTHLAIRPKGDLTLLYAVTNIIIRNGWVDARVRRSAHERLRRAGEARRRLRRRPGERGKRPRRRRDRVAGAEDPRSGTGELLLDDGREPEPPGSAHGAGDHQPGADHRQHRQARDGAELDHGPVQRDGLAPVQQHDEPHGRLRFPQRGAQAQGRGDPRHRREADPDGEQSRVRSGSSRRSTRERSRVSG